MRCVSSVSFSVMINGFPHTPFLPQRGLRQGDPISPYLFILCGEVLTAMLKKSVADEAIHGIKISQQAPVISNLSFADDSVIFFHADPDEALHIAGLLKTYESASGQMVNFDKSQLLCSQNVPSIRHNQLVQLLGVKAVESFGKYLGLPTIMGRPKSQVFSFVRDRVWKKLKGWKEKALSQAGREVLIKVVVQAIPSYVMGCFLIPLSLCDQIEKMVNRFFWGGDEDSKKIHWMSWERLARSKRKGGLGFRNFHCFNLAILAKQWWRLEKHPSTLAARLFQAVYFHDTSLKEARPGRNPTF